MKTNQLVRLFGVLFLSAFFFVACEKSGTVDEGSVSAANGMQDQGGTYRTGIRLDNGSVLAGGVTLTAPTTVNVNESFSITAEITCGRVAIERGYILDANGNKLYKNLTCATSALLWEEIVIFKCYTIDASWTGTLTEAGTYVYRTKHNAADGNCDGLGGSNQSGNCSFTGNEFYCFSIEAISCQTAFTGQAISCGTQREAVYTFSSVNAQDYIKIQGGLTNFTGADAVVTVTGGNLTATQTTPGGSSNRIIKVEGSVSACEEITVRITWNSTNSGGIITGDWSVKDENGVDIAPSVAGLTCSGRY